MKFARFFAILWFFAAAPVFAADSSVLKELYVYPSFQYFTWYEYDAGRQLLEETGPLFGAGAAVVLEAHKLDADKSLMFKGKGELFGGDVDYDGETRLDPEHPELSHLPVRTDVIYFGTKLEGDMGFRFVFGEAALEPFGGIGFRWWLRNLQSSTAVIQSGARAGEVVPVSGFTEEWTSVYTRLGLRGSYRFSREVIAFLEAGAKYPFYTSNSSDEVTVKPRGEWSAFAEVGMRYKRFRPSFFYEGFRFSPSPVVNSLLQPKSESDIFGINLAYVFR